MAEWKSIFIREKNVKKSGSKAILVACPYLSKYTGWSFWHPAKLVFNTDQQGVHYYNLWCNCGMENLIKRCLSKKIRLSDEVKNNLNKGKGGAEWVRSM